MSSPILDRARAFEMIAPHLTAERRSEIAEAIGGKLLDEIGRKRPAAPVPEAEAPTLPIDLSPHTEVASFLVDHGYTGAELVKATGRLTTFLNQHSNLTREAGMRVWLRQEKGEAA